MLFMEINIFGHSKTGWGYVQLYIWRKNIKWFLLIKEIGNLYFKIRSQCASFPPLVKKFSCIRYSY